MNVPSARRVTVARIRTADDLSMLSEPSSRSVRRATSAAGGHPKGASQAIGARALPALPLPSGCAEATAAVSDSAEHAIRLAKRKGTELARAHRLPTVFGSRWHMDMLEKRTSA